MKSGDYIDVLPKAIEDKDLEDIDNFKRYNTI